MKKFKKLSVIVIATVLTSTMTFCNVFAATNSSLQKYGEGVTVHNATQTPIINSSLKPINRIFVTDQPNNTLKPLYGESEVATVMNTAYDTVTTTPDGQLPGGTRFGSLGSGYYVNYSGGTSLSFSVAVAWNPVLSFSVGAGYAAPNNIGGVLITVPDTTYYYKVKINKTIQFQNVLIDHYQYGVYQYSNYVTWTTDWSDYCYPVRV